MTPTIERDERGYWVRLICPDGVERRVGPFSRKGEATFFIVSLQWGR